MSRVEVDPHVCACDCELHGGKKIHNDACCEPCPGCKKPVTILGTAAHRLNCAPYQMRKDTRLENYSGLTLDVPPHEYREQGHYE